MSPLNSGASIIAASQSAADLALLEGTLLAEGYQVMKADNFNDVLTKVVANRPDLLILDSSLEDAESLELCVRLKDHQVPAMFLIVITDISARNKWEHFDADGFLTKPLWPAEIIRVVRNQIGIRKLQSLVDEKDSALNKKVQELKVEAALRKKVEFESQLAIDRARRSRQALRSSLEVLDMAEAEATVRARQQLAVAELGYLALTKPDMADLLDRVTSTLCEQLGVDLSAVLELQRKDARLFLLSGAGFPKGVVGNTWLRLGGDSLSGYTLQCQEPVIVEDLSTERRFRSILSEFGVVSSITTIIGNPANPEGVLGAFSTRRRSFDTHDVYFLQGVANLLSSLWQLKREEGQRQLFSAAIEQAGESIILTDPQGTILYVNPAFESVTGYKSEEVLGENPRILKSEKHDEEFYRLLWSTISAGHTWQGRLINKRKNGSLFTEDATITPVRYPSGKIRYYVAIKRDVTKQLRVMEEMALLEDQLRHVQKVEAIGRLTGGITHDFNNMLNIIIGFGEMILSQLTTGDPLRAKVSEIVKAGRHSAALTQQLLACSRRQALHPQIIDLNAVIKNLEGILKEALPKGVNLVLDLSENLPSIKADSSQIEQILMNLTLNARDAMKSGGKLSIGTSAGNGSTEKTCCHDDQVCSDAGNHVILCVCDTGCGMDSQTIARIFEPFFTTKEKNQGTGLGLSTVHSIVEQAGGRVQVSSELGNGTAFKIYLPAIASELAVVPAEQGVAPGIKELSDKVQDIMPELPIQPGLILVVDDHAINREVAVWQLEQLGHASHAVAGGQAALDALEKNSYALVLMDVEMPQLDGFQTTRAIRGQEYGSHIPIIAMTGHESEKKRNECLAQGMDDLISKPLVRSELEKVLAKWVDGKEYHKCLQPDEDGTLDPHEEEPPGSDEPLNLSAMAENYGESTMKLQLSLLLTDTSKQVNSLHQLVRERNTESVLQHAHGLKGVFAAVFAPGLKRLCLSIEDAVHENDWIAADLLIKHLCHEFDEASEYIAARTA